MVSCFNRVVSGIGGLIEQNTPFFTVKILVTKLLQIDNCKNIHEREQLLLQHISDPEMRELLPLLNDLLVLKVLVQDLWNRMLLSTSCTSFPRQTPPLTWCR